MKLKRNFVVWSCFDQHLIVKKFNTRNQQFWLSYSACTSIKYEYPKIWQEISKLLLIFFSNHVPAHWKKKLSAQILPHLQIIWTSQYSTVYSLHINTYILSKRFFFFNLFIHKASKRIFVRGSALYPGQCSTEPNIFSLPAGKISAVCSEIST